MNKRVKELRKSLGLTQAEFADALGISKSNIVSYEGGTRSPSASFIQLVCQRFNVSRSWMETGTGDMMDLPDDQDAAIAAELAGDPENPLYRIMLDTVKTYMELDPKDREIIKNFAANILSKEKEAQG